MNRYLHYLRIAFSITCGIACVLLVVLWVRSFWRHTIPWHHVTPTHRYYVHSLGGTVAWEKEQRVFITREMQRIYEESDYYRLKTNAGLASCETKMTTCTR